MFPIKKHITLASIPADNRWGAKRKYDYHTGVDLFCEEGTEVYAVEDGIVTDVCGFTGPGVFTNKNGELIELKWWNYTMCASVEGKTGVFLYGELFEPAVTIGQAVREGDLIGRVKTVLSKDKGRPMCMLHIELYDHGYRGTWDGWWPEQPKPESLRNVEEYLEWPE